MKPQEVYEQFLRSKMVTAPERGTVPLRAIKLGRVGWGCELSPRYFKDSCFYCEAMERKMATPNLFDLLAADESEEDITKSDSRKAASAQIARIPFPLASYIARAFQPDLAAHAECLRVGVK